MYWRLPTWSWQVLLRVTSYLSHLVNRIYSKVVMDVLIVIPEHRLLMLFLNKITFIRETRIVLVLSMLKRFNLSPEVDFAFKKLFSYQVFLILLFIDRLGLILSLQNSFSAVCVFHRYSTFASFRLHLVGAWFDCRTSVLYLPCISVLALIPCLFEVVIWNVPSFLFLLLPSSGVSKSRLG